MLSLLLLIPTVCILMGDSLYKKNLARDGHVIANSAKLSIIVYIYFRLYVDVLNILRLYCMIDDSIILVETRNRIEFIVNRLSSNVKN